MGQRGSRAAHSADHDAPPPGAGGTVRVAPDVLWSLGADDGGAFGAAVRRELARELATQRALNAAHTQRAADHAAAEIETMLAAYGRVPPPTAADRAALAAQGAVTACYRRTAPVARTLDCADDVARFREAARREHRRLLTEASTTSTSTSTSSPLSQASTPLVAA